MIEVEGLPNLKELLAQSPSSVLAFIEEWWSDPENTSSPFNEQPHYWWLWLARGARDRAFPEDEIVNLEWVEIAIEAYRKLSIEWQRNYNDPYLLDRYEDCLRLIQVNLIRAMESDQIVSLASVDALIQWFFDSLPMSYEEVMVILPEVRRQMKIREQVDQKVLLVMIRKLRGIKQRLRHISRLPEPHSPEVIKWLELLEKLP